MGMMPPGSHGPVIWWGGWGRGRRKPESGPANSGLTGDPTLEPPQQPEGPKDLRGRWEGLKQAVTGTTAALPQVLGLVWEASRPVTIALFATTALAGVIPTISVGLTLTLTNAVVAGIKINAFHLPDHVRFSDLGVSWLPGPTFSAVGMIVFLAGLQLVVFAFSALLNTLRNISQQLLQNSVSMRIQLMVMIATAFGLLQTLLTLVTMIALLFGVSWILAVVVIVSPIPAFIADTRYGWRGYNIARWGSRLLRRMTYMVNLVTTDSFAKEVKLFGLGGYFIERYRLIANAFYKSQRSQVVRRYMTGFALGNLCTIKAGETLAVVGRNGAGKTTLFKLICRLYDPLEGRILIDGVDIRDFEPAQLRRQIGAMFQDYVDYQATASENIGLGNVPDIANRDAVVSASKQAGSDELIANLPDGYDTALGKWFDAGVNLSGGEWQKVALARAFMREDAKILLLDEPTSALDAQAEYDLFERLRSLTHGRTAVYISHRFSTVRRADRIVFLEHGRLVEEGTHEELMRLGGRYARLFRMQAAAYTGEDVEILPEEVLSN